MANLPKLIVLPRLVVVVAFLFLLGDGIIYLGETVILQILPTSLLELPIGLKILLF